MRSPARNFPVFANHGDAAELRYGAHWANDQPRCFAMGGLRGKSNGTDARREERDRRGHAARAGHGMDAVRRPPKDGAGIVFHLRKLFGEARELLIRKRDLFIDMGKAFIRASGQDGVRVIWSGV